MAGARRTDKQQVLRLVQHEPTRADAAIDQAFQISNGGQPKDPTVRELRVGLFLIGKVKIAVSRKVEVIASAKGSVRMCVRCSETAPVLRSNCIIPFLYPAMNICTSFRILRPFGLRRRITPPYPETHRVRRAAIGQTEYTQPKGCHPDRMTDLPGSCPVNVGTDCCDPSRTMRPAFAAQPAIQAQFRSQFPVTAEIAAYGYHKPKDLVASRAKRAFIPQKMLNRLIVGRAGPAIWG